MIDWSTFLDVLILGGVAFASFVFDRLRRATDTAVDEAAKAAAIETIDRLNWSAKLTRELQQSRGIKRQELRFDSYSALWEELSPLAVYDHGEIDQSTVTGLSSSLTKWYFSKSGGLLLTKQAREFYFALQELLRSVAGIQSPWTAEQGAESTEAHRQIVEDVAATYGSGKLAELYEFLDSESLLDGWDARAHDIGKQWREEVRSMAAAWTELSPVQRFAVVQQAGSVLRTVLTSDLDSRLQ